MAEQHIISVDAGNGGTNAILLRDGRNKSTYFPSVRAAATGNDMGFGEMEMAYDYVDWGGHRYVVGDDVVTVTRNAVERHQGAMRYGNEFHQFLVAYAIRQLNVKDGEIDLTLFAPPGMYKAASESIKKYFPNGDGWVAIQMKKDKQPAVWRYTNINVLPEGIGAVLCYAFEPDGTPIPNADALKGTTLVLDSGMYTFDAVAMTNGKFNPENLKHTTWENGGLGVHVHQPVLEKLKATSSDFDFTTIDDIDMVIRNGLQHGDWYIRSGTQQVNLQELIEKMAERFANWVSNNIIDGPFHNLRGISNVILVGGGTTLIEKHLTNWYNTKESKRILNPKDFPSAKGIHPTMLNVEGGIRYAQFKRRQAEKA